MSSVKKQVSPTIKSYNNWNAAKWGLYAGMWSAPFIPATVMTIINWDEWFAQTGVSLPLGFVSLLVSTLFSIILIWKKDDITNKAISAVYYLAIIFVFFGASLLFLANLFSQVGYMFLATAGGLMASGTADQINKSVVKPNVEYYKNVISKNYLDKKSKRLAAIEEQAQKDAEAENGKDVKF